MRKARDCEVDDNDRDRDRDSDCGRDRDHDRDRDRDHDEAKHVKHVEIQENVLQLCTMCM